MSLFTDFLKDISLKLNDLTSIGLPKSSSSASDFFVDLYDKYPERYNFYIQLLESITSSNPEVVRTLLSKENIERFKNDKTMKSVRDIESYFLRHRFEIADLKNTLTIIENKDVIDPVYAKVPLNELIEAKKVFSKTPYTFDNAPGAPATAASLDVLKNTLQTNSNITPGNITTLTTYLESLKTSDTDPKFQSKTITIKDALDTIIERKKMLIDLKKLNTKLQENPYESTTKNIKIMKDTDPTKGVPLDTVTEGGAVYEKGLDDTLKKRIFGTTTPAAITPTDPEKIDSSLVTDEEIERYNKDPMYSPDIEKVTMTDRVIFIAATYIVRAISMFMLEWAVHTNFVNTFVKGFSLYFGVYVCIFLLLYILTNAKEDDEIFRMIFYYIYTKSEDGQGVVRIILHLLCIFMLIPIPFVVREYREFEKDSMTFVEKRTILNGVSRFTMYVWILTSIVALKV